MRLSYIVILGLVIAGFFVGRFLLPTSEEVAIMKLDGSGLLDSQATYETQLTTGNLSPEVVFPLVRIYLENNELNRAIALLEAYLVRNPNDIRALDRLSTLYQYAGRQDDYTKTLERMNAVKTDPENLQKLSDIYNSKQEYEKQAVVLEKLLENNPDDSKNYLQLSYIYRELGRHQDVAKVLELLAKNKPNAMNQDVIESWVIALTQIGRHDEALAIASNWVNLQPKNEQREKILRLSNIFYAGRRPDLSLILLQPYSDQTNDSEVTAALIRVAFASGQTNVAFERMSALYKDGKLPDNLYELFLEAAIERRDVDMIKSLTTPAEVAKIPEFRLIQLTEFYQEEKTPEAIRNLRIAVGADRMKILPALDAIMALAVYDMDGKAKAEAQLANADRQVFQTIALSKAALLAQYTDLSKQFLISLRPYDKVEDYDLGSVAWLMLQHKMIDEGLQTFSEFRVTRPSLLVDLAWVKMAAAHGDEKQVVQWMNNYADDVMNPRILRDIYYISNDFNHQGIALHAAKRLYWRTAADDDQYLYATALVNNDKKTEAFEHVRELRENGYAMDNTLYTSLLYIAAQNDKRYQPELVALLETELQQPDISDQRRYAVLQSFLSYDNSAVDPYLPYVRGKAKATNGKGEWQYLYEAYLRKLGKTTELASLRKDSSGVLVIGPNSSPEDKRRYAFNKLSEGKKQEATNIFMQLSGTARPGNKDLEQLLYLWGPRPESDKLDWMADRALRAQGNERAEWLNIIYNAGGYQQVMNVVEKLPESQRGDAEDKAYFNALEALNSNKNIEPQMLKMVSATQDVRRLEALRAIALSKGYNAASDEALDRLIRLKPDDITLLRDRGMQLYANGKYAEAMEAFNQYHAKSGTDYRTYYYVGEMLKEAERKNDSLRYYQRALLGAKMVNPQTMESRLISAQSLTQLDRIPEAIALMDEVLKEGGDNKNLKADYLMLLIKEKRYDEAYDFLQKPETTKSATVTAPAAATRQPAPAPIQQGEVKNTMPQKIVTFEPMAAPVKLLVLPRDNVVSVRNSQVAHELVIKFKTMADGKQPVIQELNANKPSWLRTAVTSYDSVLLVADNGISLSSDFANTTATDAFTISGYVAEEKAKPVSTARKNARMSDDAVGAMRMEILRAQLELQTGNQSDARERLMRLNEQYPNNPGILAALSSVEWYMGYSQSALENVEKSLALSPQNEAAIKLRDKIKESRRSFAKVDVEGQLLDDDTQIIVQLHGEKRVDNKNAVGIIADNNLLSAQGVRRSNGDIGDYDAFRTRQDLYWRHDFDNGDQTRLSAYFNEKDVGVGGQYLTRYAYGDIAVDAEYHKPNWDFIEGVLDFANRDRVAYNQNFRIRNDIAPNIQVAYNRYNLDGEDDVARSVTATGVARLPLYYLDSGIDRRLFMEYGLDAEYREETQRGIDGIGISYLLYPLVTREVHYLTLGWRQEIENRFIDPSYWEIFGGYAYDRFGGDGPYIGGRWVEQLDANKEFQLRFSQSIGFKDSSASAFRVGGYFKWKFD